MLDLIQLSLQAGNGGDGRVSFRREKYVPKGGPDGGDGGDGGSIFVIGDKNLNTLQSFAGKTTFRAESGEIGGKARKSGKKGEDLYLHVPLGTVVWEVTQVSGQDVSRQKLDTMHASEKQESEQRIVRQKELKSIDTRKLSKQKIIEILEDGQVELVCQGGTGGRGNDHFKSSTNQVPKQAEKGTSGQKRKVLFELKLLADIGLVGYPNAGKSTFLSVITRANPKIANYPFTTLEPNLGVTTVHDREIVIADIPGLIEGASQGKGLGYQFLRHIERCRALMFVLFIQDDQLAADHQAEQLWNSFQELQRELADYDPSLLKLSFFITINKMDLYSQDLQQRIAHRFNQEGQQVIFWSGLSGEGVDQLKEQMWQLVVDKR